MATLDATAYPHIFERVRAHAGYDLLIRLRLVNRASSALATAALFTHVIITRVEEDVTILRRKEASPPRLILLSSTGGRLPVPPLRGDAYIPKLPEHRGWAHTCTLDIETIVRGLDQQAFPALKTVRRRVWTEDAPDAPTYVDAMPLPPEPGVEAYIDNVPEGTRKHVIVVLYDPNDQRLAEDNTLNVDFCESNVHGVFVFASAPANGLRPAAIIAGMGDGPALAVRQGGLTAGGVDDDGSNSIIEADLGHDDMVEAHCEEASHTDDDDDDDDMSDGLSDNSLLNGPHLTLNPNRTFLNNFLWCAAQRTHQTYTLVGIEGVPPALLAKEFELDPEDVAARSRGPTDEWAKFVEQHVIEAIKGVEYDHIEEEEEVYREVEEVVEVLTMAQYRARVGDEVWASETFGDGALGRSLG